MWENPEQLYPHHISSKYSVASCVYSIHGCRSVLGTDGNIHQIDKNLRQSLIKAQYVFILINITLFIGSHNCLSVDVYFTDLKQASLPSTPVTMGLKLLLSCLGHLDVVATS